jgi:hypothetical protein
MKRAIAGFRLAFGSSGLNQTQNRAETNRWIARAGRFVITAFQSVITKSRKSAKFGFS